MMTTMMITAGSTLGRHKNPIKQLPWSKGKPQLVTIISKQEEEGEEGKDVFVVVEKGIVIKIW